jgi:hypothetical protein
MKMINFDKAKQLALEAAEEQFGEFKKSGQLLLDSDVLIESDFCWIFLRNQKVEIPDERWSLKGVAIAVSHTGEIRLIADHENDVEALKIYAERLSAHFRSIPASL